MVVILALVLVLIGVSLGSVGMRRLGQATRRAVASVTSRTAPAPISPKPSETEARALLGVPLGASADAVKAAHLRLIRRVHPDQGGTNGLAAQLNAARDRLIGR